YSGTFFMTDCIINIFNSEQNLQVAELAKIGLRIYFIGLFFAGINIVMTAHLSAIERAKNAFSVSILRGFVVIIPMVFLLSRLWGMTGVWLSFVLTELIVILVAIFVVRSNRGKQILKPKVNEL